MPPKRGPHCLAMNVTGLPTFLVSTVSPSLRAGVEPWVLEVAEQAGCDALGSVGTGIGTHVDTEGGEKMEMAAPMCTASVKLRSETGEEDDGTLEGGGTGEPPPPPKPSKSPSPGKIDEEEEEGPPPKSSGQPPTDGRPGPGGGPSEQLLPPVPPASQPPPLSLLRQTHNITGDDDNGGISVHLHVVRVLPRIMTIQPGASPYVEFWPMDAWHIPPPDKHLQLQLLQQDTMQHTKGFSWEVAGICTSLGISSMRVTLAGGSWTGLYSDEMRTTFAVHELLCQAHEQSFPGVTGRNVVALDDVLDMELALTCRRGARKQEFDATCLHRLAIKASESGTDNINNSSTTRRRKLIYSTTLDRMWTFILGHDGNSTSYGCANATVRVSYIFVTPAFVMNFKINAARHAALVGEIPFPEYTTLIPLHFSVLSGHCERVVHVLGRAALSYAADAHWRNTTLSRLSLVDTLHTFLIATASIQLPLTDLDVAGAGLKKQWCETRTAVNVTLLERDWRVWMLGCAVVVAVVLTAVAILFRGAFRGGAWIVGSAHWMLEQVERGEAKGYVRQQSQRDGAAINMEVVIKGSGGGDVATAGSGSSGVGGTSVKKRAMMANDAKIQEGRKGGRKWWTDVQGFARALSKTGAGRVYELRTLPKGGQHKAVSGGGDDEDDEEKPYVYEEEANIDEKAHYDDEERGQGAGMGDGLRTEVACDRDKSVHRHKSDSTAGATSYPSTSRARLSDASSKGA